VLWSLDSKDYLNEPADKVIERIQKNLKNKDIVLMHDGPNGHPELVKIVEQTLKSIN
jgi:peptidoglycan/xylan/chitin deacetylase (PgdA/CDA1 family)